MYCKGIIIILCYYSTFDYDYAYLKSLKANFIIFLV